MVHLLRDRALAQRLRVNDVSQTEMFWYVLLFLLLLFFSDASFISVWAYQDINRWDIVEDIMVLMATLLGTSLCFRTNQRGDHRSFVERYVCLSLPVTIQTIVFIFTPLHLAVIIVFELILDLPIPDQTSIYDVSILSVVYLYYYWRLNSSMRIAAQGGQAHGRSAENLH